MTNSTGQDSPEAQQDCYAHEMDWGESRVSIGSLSNYRQYQYDLVAPYVGTDILEIGCGASRSFTKKIIANRTDISRLVSIEPSEVLLNAFEKLDDYRFPDYSTFIQADVFDLNSKDIGLFDTVFLIHVLEHIERDRDALDHIWNFLASGSRLLIEVPALQCLFSDHDRSLGHYRRYNKKTLLSTIDQSKYKVLKIWYNDPIGILGSLLFFKFRKIKLRSEEGVKVVENQGMLYDRYLIPFQAWLEKYIEFPIGLSLAAVLEKIEP